MTVEDAGTPLDFVVFVKPMSLAMAAMRWGCVREIEFESADSVTLIPQ